MRIDAALRQARERLASSPSPDLDAQVLLCHVLARPRSYLFTWPERELEAHQQQSFLALLARREQGEPVAHLTGEREFFGRNFSVTPDTLIPRPDTETLVELALKLGPAGPARVVDLGTGTGAIGVTLALERPQWQVTLTDLSAAALSVAGGNARQLGAQVTLQQGSWLEDCRGPFDVIVSNPPYIDPADHHLDEGDVRFEPRSALVADQRGLADLATIITQSAARLVAGGWLLLEHGYQQGAQVRALMEAGRFDGVRTERDLGGNERVTVGRQLIVNN
ncbi:MULTISPECIES: peptide chain release factor N(5)-glutamine methyltransferase [unclassified Alcanivorax]|jgi:release factor glutamine methyltransferase|uniref:peptide chain release factor N(5)-glutamine methyltransferase n=1 Tax=unclassified Alcanivorax TaxID=2638842 RepID=UPI0008A05A8C|nr:MULTISPECIES: peptide chain release factor N(5)-glutamine methyltransferase [unclassified Alcanivorax]MBB09943.1 protein-(glutamine-N5) methyltransferase, release factor-specific [Alcanivorax sp.]MBU85863.1 protein-(glutamine-N5) methyltransferase, release factor-specific [Alcanivorax sp.]MEE3387653.1 peptide chain release factor N(5)-glutamine methyltransferase [Pseudomonadota bacterium]SEF50645.1 [protein release factor]-glutamine N5-methyltransferase [Alcanivorax sp. DSM 26293]